MEFLVGLIAGGVIIVIFISGLKKFGKGSESDAPSGGGGGGGSNLPKKPDTKTQ